jgi:hypothetical protein
MESPKVDGERRRQKKETMNERDVRNSRTADEMESHKGSSKHLPSRRGEEKWHRVIKSFLSF